MSAVTGGKPAMRAAIVTAGCRLNQAESDALSAWLRLQGFTVVREPAEADVCYVNTCTVTAAADRSSLQLVRRAAGRDGTRVVVMGCLAERRPERLREIPGVSEVWSAREKRRATGLVPVPVRSRPLLKVQDGCDRGCAFCVVSRVRGAPVSVDPDRVAHAVADLVSAGHCEVVLTGLNLGRYHHGATRLAGLLARLLCVPGSFRLRLGSLEPDSIDDRLVEALADERICPHFHLALQSADDRLLTAMNRRYGFAAFRRLVGRLVRDRTDACIGADVISGLPGESPESAGLTHERLAELPLAYLHAFTYSVRPGTPAAQMPGRVPAHEASARTARLRRLSTEFGRRYASRFPGSVRDAVVESDRVVVTDNYLRVRLCEPTAIAARRNCRVRIESMTASVSAPLAALVGLCQEENQ